MHVKIPDGQRLHMREQMNADILHRAFGNCYHQALIAIRAHSADNIDHGKPEQRSGERAEIPASGLHHRKDVIIDQ